MRARRPRTNYRTVQFSKSFSPPQTRIFIRFAARVHIINPFPTFATASSNFFSKTAAARFHEPQPVTNASSNFASKPRFANPCPTLSPQDAVPKENPSKVKILFQHADPTKGDSARHFRSGAGAAPQGRTSLPFRTLRPAPSHPGGQQLRRAPGSHPSPPTLYP